jgi:hypothetical protein
VAGAIALSRRRIASGARSTFLCLAAVDCRGLKPKVSQFLEIMTRRGIRHNVLFRGYPEYGDLDVKDGRNEEDCLERLDGFSSDGFVPDRLDNRGVVAC